MGRRGSLDGEAVTSIGGISIRGGSPPSPLARAAVGQPFNFHPSEETLASHDALYRRYRAVRAPGGIRVNIPTSPPSSPLRTASSLLRATAGLRPSIPGQSGRLALRAPQPLRALIPVEPRLRIPSSPLPSPARNKFSGISPDRMGRMRSQLASIGRQYRNLLARQAKMAGRG
ncbi:MAG: hypothetical protein JSR76_06905 [Verrucomicrobia bacterium]|nr:hypothetical protein [Verrucomicrobiota bacterium]